MSHATRDANESGEPDPWFVARVKPGAETQVVALLAHRHVEAFCPRIPARPSLGRGGRRTEPLFPGYVFARLAVETSQWIEARSAPGVQHFLPRGGLPLAVDPQLVATIQQRTEGQLQKGWAPAFQPGDAIVVEDGPFRGLEGVFDGSLPSGGRVRVLLGLLNRQTPVELEGRILRAIPKRAPGVARRSILRRQ